jgi:hypothetical protein
MTGQKECQARHGATRHVRFFPPRSALRVYRRQLPIHKLLSHVLPSPAHIFRLVPSRVAAGACAPLSSGHGALRHGEPWGDGLVVIMDKQRDILLIDYVLCGYRNKDSGVEGFPLRSWSIEVYLINDHGEQVSANVFDKVTYKLHPSFGDRATQGSFPVYFHYPTWSVLVRSVL